MSRQVASGAGSAVPPLEGDLVPVEVVARALDAEPASLLRWLAPVRGIGYPQHEVDWLRAARAFVDDGLPARRIRGALQRLREHWTGAADPPRVLGRVGRHVVVVDARGEWSAESGQEWLPLEAVSACPPAASVQPQQVEERAPGPATIVDLEQARRRRRALTFVEAATPVAAAAALYRAAIEEPDTPRAIALLEQVVALDTGHVEAWLDLGALLHERGELDAAERCYREALRLEPGNATAWFDLGVALEDRGDDRAALAAYRRSIAADPEDADAWFNAARLLERLGDRAAAIAHLARYRRLERRPGR